MNTPPFDQVYCDNCGDETRRLDRNEFGDFYVWEGAYWISELIISIDSANAGESAVLCNKCFLQYQQNTEVKRA